MNFRTTFSYLLVGFVLISVGFAIGKEKGYRTAETRCKGMGRIDTPSSAVDQVIVYYTHGSIRCVTCVQIEEMAKEVVETRFSREVEEGRLKWAEVNFEEDTELANRYDVVTSGLVVVEVRDGEEVRLKKLDEVWQLVSDREVFYEYVHGHIEEYFE